VTIKQASERGPVFAQLSRQLREQKYGADFIDRIIPSWWTPEAEADPNGLDHLKLLLAQNLGLDMPALLRDGRVQPVAPSGMRFKRSSDLKNEKPADPNLAYFSVLAKSVAATVGPSVAIPTNPKELHQQILAMPGVSCVKLPALLDYCWSRNIAVIHVDTCPVKKAGLDALVYRVNDRYVIIVVRKDGAEAGARAAFTIAHELGHIALGHVPENVGLIEDPSDEEKHLVDERKADDFAGVALSGGRYKSSWRHGAKRADTLAERAESYEQEWRIDAGHILLRWGFETGMWKNAIGACKHLYPLPAPTHDFINDVARKRLDTSRVSRDTQDLLERTLVAA
jgi:hypothetical protein